MVCKLQRPTPQELWDKTSNMFSSTVLGGSPVIPESNEHYVVALDYALQENFYTLGERMTREMDPRYACCENLYAIAAVDGVIPSPPAPAEGYVRLTGDPNAPLTQDIEFQFGNEKYMPAATVPPTLDDQGEAIVRARALVAGPGGNVPSDTPTGQLLTPLTGVDSEVTVYGGRFCGGSVGEECEDFRQRYLRRLAFRPIASMEWIREKLSQWPCVTDVCDYGGVCCNDASCYDQGCVDRVYFYVMMRGTFDCGLPPKCVLDEINEWLFGAPQGMGLGQVEMGLCGEVLLSQAVRVDLRIDGFACSTSEQRRDLESRIRDYIDKLCPSRILYLKELEAIAAHVLGKAIDFSIAVNPQSDDCTQMHLAMDECGNAVPVCGFKVCVDQILFVNPVAPGGCA